MKDVKIVYWDTSKLVPYEKNAKNHDKKQVEKIAKSISQFGWAGNPIVVNESGVILAGHGRRLAAMSLDMKQVPVQVISGLSEDAQRAYRLADNRVAISDLDEAILKQELESLEFDLDGIFDKKEIDFILADLGEMTTGAFIEDVDSVVRQQQADTQHNIEESAISRVSIVKALGFKDIAGSSEIIISKFMATIRAEFGDDPEVAFVGFVKAIGEASK